MSQALSQALEGFGTLRGLITSFEGCLNNIFVRFCVYNKYLIRFVKNQNMKKVNFVFYFLAIIAMFFSSCSKDASIREVKLCNNPSGDQCVEDMTDFFGVETDTIHLFASLTDAPENVKVEVTWFYQAVDKDKEEIMRGSFDGNESSTIHAMLYLNTPGWPSGEYSVNIKIADSESEPVEKKFKIE